MTTSSVQAWTFGSGTAQAVSTDDLGRFSTGEVYVVLAPAANHAGKQRLYLWAGEGSPKEARTAAARHAGELMKEDAAFLRQKQGEETPEFKQLFPNFEIVREEAAAEPVAEEEQAEAEAAPSPAPTSPAAPAAAEPAEAADGPAEAAPGQVGAEAEQEAEVEAEADVLAAGAGGKKKKKKNKKKQQQQAEAEPEPEQQSEVAVAEVEAVAAPAPALPPASLPPQFPAAAAPPAASPAKEQPSPAAAAAVAASAASPAPQVPQESASPPPSAATPTSPAAAAMPPPSAAKAAEAVATPAAAPSPAAASPVAAVAVEEPAAKPTPARAPSASPKVPAAEKGVGSESVSKKKELLMSRLSGTSVDPLAQKQQQKEGAPAGTKTSATYLADSAKAWGGVSGGAPAAEGVTIKPGQQSFGYEELKGMRGDSGIDPTAKEAYLSDAEFEKVFGKDRAAFKAQPAWRQQLVKKQVGLW